MPSRQKSRFTSRELEHHQSGCLEKVMEFSPKTHLQVSNQHWLQGLAWRRQIFAIIVIV
jgi:hypothetical protein